MLTVTYAESHMLALYADAECRYAECRGTPK